MSSHPQATPVLQQDLALDLYLKTLLAAVPEFEVDALESSENTIAPLPQSALDIQTNAATLVTSTLDRQLLPIALAVPSLSKDLAVGAPVHHQDLALLAAPKAKPVQSLSVMPEWSRSEFQALFFKVDHLILATPLIELSRTLVFNRKPTKLPLQPAWFIGLIEDQGQKLAILDSGQLIFGKARGSIRDLQTRPFKYILVSGDGCWGLACDEIVSVSKIMPDNVRWRTSRKQRPWLIGTIIDELTAVIDVSQLLPGKKSNALSK